MKKLKNSKKIISMVAVLALSATAVVGAVSFAGCGDSESSAVVSSNNEASANTTTISTAKGVVQTRSSGNVYYVSPDASRTGTGASWDDPMPIDLVLGNNSSTFSPLQPGDTVYVKPGVYEWNTTWSTGTTGLTMTASGAYNSYIRIINAALDSQSGYTGSETEAIISFYGQNFSSTARGVQIYGDYIYWYGIDVCGAGDNGLYVAGSYNTIEYCDFYNNRDTGLQLGRAESSQTSVDEWPNYNLIKNCTSHNNYDNETYGENADGFAAKLTVGYGNVFDGCIAYRNSDDGWDLYAKTDSGNIGQVIIYNCVAFENGYLEYTQRECNALYPTWTGIYSEDENNSLGSESYMTRDGDGNGFKLGGSVMEGDVIMYNCLSFGNRMHGVTDNSNPGVLSVNYTTSYNNSGAVCDDPESDYFGYILDIANKETHGNIDVARQTYSYNNLSHVLAVKDGLALSLDADAYRASVTDSILGNYKIEGNIDADTKNSGGNKGTSFTAPASADIFTTLPYTKSADGEYTFNITGVCNLYGDIEAQTLNPDRVHLKYRNEDHSINMGDILSVKDYSILLGEDNPIGSVLNLTSYDEYTHFYESDLVNANAGSEAASIVARAKETLQINCNPEAVYQDFDVPSKLTTCEISWTSSNEEYLSVGTEKDISISQSEYIIITVNRPLEEDVKVTLTATITCGTVSDTKDFEITVKAGTPYIGEVQVLTQDGEIVSDGASIIIDQYVIYREPTVQVTNGLDYNGKLLNENLYTVESKYMYATNSKENAVEIKDFTPSTPGVYNIYKTVTMGKEVVSMSYTIYVASATAKVDFVGDAVIGVNRDGYTISGEVSSATGYLYSIASTSELDVTVDNIKTLEGVVAVDFRGDTINIQYPNDNNSAYYIYYAFTNLNGEVTSTIYSQKIEVVEVSSETEFMSVAGGKAIGSEDSSLTIYQLTKDLDFTDVTYSIGTGSFKSLLNGMSHTVSNVTINTNANYASLFYKVEGGTIENIKFNNIVINGAQSIGIVSRSYGGYYYNIAITNIRVSGTQRVAALIGQVFEGSIPTYIDQISIVNPLPTVDEKGAIDNEDTAYIIKASANRAAGIIGLIQTNTTMTNDIIIYIANCYVSSYIVCYSYTASSIVGEYQDSYGSGYAHVLDITNCVSASIIVSMGASSRLGGIVAYQTGTDVLNITGCISIGTFYYSGAEVLASQKNISGIMGNFNSAAPTVIKNCYAMMEEYNTDYQEGVTILTETTKGRVNAYNNAGFDTETLWTFNYEEGSTTRLESPYITLNFLGEWE